MLSIPAGFPKQVAYLSVARLSIPAVQFIGNRIMQGGIGGIMGWSVIGGSILSFVLKPQESTQFVQTSFETATNYTSLFFSVVADYLRSEEKKGIELVSPAEPVASEAQKVKFYTLDDFPYFFSASSGTKMRLTGNPDADKFIIDYKAFNIDIVSMILKDHQLPDLKFMRKIRNIRSLQIHPDKGGSTNQTILLNDAYRDIKNMMSDPEAQLDLLRIVLQFFKKEDVSPYPFAILFVAGGTISFLLFPKREKSIKK